MAFTVRQVEKLIREAQPGAHADGEGLYLKIGPTGAASWQLRYQINGKRRSMGLGACAEVTLAQARIRAAEARKLVKAGTDPLAQKEADERLIQAQVTTFKMLAQQYIDSHRPGWKNAKHAQQWGNTLEQYAYPVIGDKPVAEVSTADVLTILRPIWQSKAETASRVRNRIELVIDAGRAQGLSGLPNPAAWRGHLDKLLPKRSKTSKGHHPALPWQQMGVFMADLRTREGVAARAVEFCILTAARSGEVRLCEWREFDLVAGLWIVPAGRMKAGREHRVALSAPALALLKAQKAAHPESSLVFPGSREGKPLSDMSLTAVIRRMHESATQDGGEGYVDPLELDENGNPRLATVHGMRSAFSDWAAEATAYPRDMVELALAHMVGDKVEAAYRRGDMLDKRKRMMDAWGEHCASARQSGKVVALRGAA